MSQVTIRWTQRVAGRMPGETETVEETAFISACISQKRCDVVVPAAILGVFEDAASAAQVAEDAAKAAEAQAQQAVEEAAKAAALAAAQKADDEAKAALATADAELAAAAAEVTPEA